MRPYSFLVAALLIVLTGCNRCDTDKGNICLALGDYEMAQYFFGRVLQKDPAHFEARLGKGKALLQKMAAVTGDDAQSWRRALIHLEAAADINPQHDLRSLLSEVWYRRSHAFLSKGDTAASLDALTRSVEFNAENIEALNTAGIIYFRLGETDKAEEIFKRAIKIDNVNTTLLFNLGMIYYRQDDLLQAHRLWFSALQNSPDDSEIIYWFAMAEKELRASSENISSPSVFGADK